MKSQNWQHVIYCMLKSCKNIPKKKNAAKTRILLKGTSKEFFYIDILWQKHQRKIRLKPSQSSFLPSIQFWIVASISASCAEIIILEHEFLEITFDFGQIWRSFLSVKQLTLTLLFIFRDGIWFALIIGTAILLSAHLWGTNVPLDCESSRGCGTKIPNYELCNP